jgi:CHAD domain-containing protein
VAYSFETQESVPQSISRVVLEQIDGAIQDLTNEAIDRHEGVHEARKRFKMIRAVLRLIRGELGEAYQQESTEFREFGKKLSAVRDAEAMVETFDKLNQRLKQRIGMEAFPVIRDNLIRRRQIIADEEEDLERSVSEVVNGLQAARNRVASWPLSEDSFEAIGPGLERIYAQGRSLLRKAYQQTNADLFHEWRKRVKDHWYHSRLLRNIWPQVMDGHIETLHRLSELLGDDHDLVVFREAMAGQPDVFGGADNVERLRSFLDQRQQELRTDAQPIGRRIYAEKSKPFRTRMEHYWDVWRER